MLCFEYIDNCSCPIIRCDLCGEQITTGSGNVEWREPWKVDGKIPEWRIVHKPFECKSQEAGKDDWLYWEELYRWLAQLGLNTGLTMTDLAISDD